MRDLARRTGARLGAGLACLALGLTGVGAGALASLPASAAEEAPSTGATDEPTDESTGSPTDEPSDGPSDEPSDGPTGDPSDSPSPTPSTPTPSGPTSGTPTPSPGDGGVRKVEDAVFAWSFNQQSNAQSHNPIADNYFSAGEANPGRGGMILKRTQWKASEGNVEIQKVDTSGRWKQATWGGLGTDAKGEKIGLYGPFSGHRVRISGGTGSLDAAKDDATLQWKGTFTVVYYGGNTVFTLSDPTLTLRGGKGRLTATGGGWSADRLDPTVWKRVAPKNVPVVEVSGVDVTRTGLVATPSYREVTVTGPEEQVRTGEHWGSFPQEFVTFLEPMGASQFWYSTGLQSDWTKVPEPLSVAWDGAEPTKGPTTPTKGPEKRPQPTNEVVQPPSRTAAPTTPPVTVPLPSSVPDAEAPDGSVSLPGIPAQVQAARYEDLQAVPVSARTDSLLDDPRTGWFVGGGLLLAAAALLLVPAPARRP